MTEPMTDARLAGIDAVIRKPRGPVRDHTLAIAAVDLLAEVRRLRAENERLDTLADELANALAESDTDAASLEAENADLRAQLAAKEA